MVVRCINLEDLENLSKDIAKWHEETFPNANTVSQMEKLEEELEEMDMEINPYNMFQELVDVFIVASALFYRFDSHLGLHVLQIIKERIKYNFRFIDFVKEKMEINKQRDWKEIGDGYYHH